MGSISCFETCYEVDTKQFCSSGIHKYNIYVTVDFGIQLGSELN